MLSRAQKALGVPEETRPETPSPGIPLPLLEWLEFRFPNDCPPPGISREDFIELSAKTSLVKELRGLYEKQNKR